MRWKTKLNDFFSFCAWFDLSSNTMCICIFFLFSFHFNSIWWHFSWLANIKSEIKRFFRAVAVVIFLFITVFMMCKKCFMIWHNNFCVFLKRKNVFRFVTKAFASLLFLLKMYKMYVCSSKSFVYTLCVLFI